MRDGRDGYWLVQMEWRPTGWSVCMPLLVFPCTIKFRSSLLAPAHTGGPGKGAVKRLCGGLYIMVVRRHGVWQTTASAVLQVSIYHDTSGDDEGDYGYSDECTQCWISQPGSLQLNTFQPGWNHFWAISCTHYDKFSSLNQLFWSAVSHSRHGIALQHASCDSACL